MQIPPTTEEILQDSINHLKEKIKQLKISILTGGKTYTQKQLRKKYGKFKIPARIKELGYNINDYEFYYDLVDDKLILEYRLIYRNLNDMFKDAYRDKLNNILL